MTKKLDLVRFSGTLPIKLADKLKSIALKEGRSMNAVFNIAMDKYCGDYERETQLDK